MGDYTEALNKDLKRIDAELTAIGVALKRNPKDAAALKKKAQIMPFLEEASLKKRYDNARQMDAKAMNKKITELGF